MGHSGGASLKFCKGSGMPATAKGPLMPFQKWPGLARDFHKPRYRQGLSEEITRHTEDCNLTDTKKS